MPHTRYGMCKLNLTHKPNSLILFSPRARSYRINGYVKNALKNNAVKKAVRKAIYSQEYDVP
jgi:hypothetical protein